MLRKSASCRTEISPNDNPALKNFSARHFIPEDKFLEGLPLLLIAYEKARKVIEVLLEKYRDEGIEEMENSEILKVSPINKLGRPLEIMKLFGGVVGYKKMIKEIEARLYK